MGARRAGVAAVGKGPQSRYGCSCSPCPKPMPEPAVVPVRVWDLPTRVFHWTLALAVVGSVISAKIGGNAMVWHFRLGYVVLTQLVKTWFVRRYEGG